MKNDVLYIVMPAYNEEGNIASVVKDWYSVLDGKSEASRLVVADFGSMDKTHVILEDLRDNGYSKLVLLPTAQKQHGPKLMSLYDYAIKNEADYVFQTDSDGQTSIADFDKFWNNRCCHSAIFGWRKCRGDGILRAFVEKVVCCLLKLYFGVSVPDANAPFRLMNVDILTRYLCLIPSDYNLPNIMLTAYFAKYESDICFEQVLFGKRTNGINSVNLKKIMKIGFQALHDFGIFRKNMRAIK